MVDFDFYVNSYLGSAIPEKAFPGAMVQAQAVLEKYRRCYQVTGGEESEAMALCAMAETLYAAGKRRGGVASASVGGVSVRYDSGEDSQKALKRELFQRASIFLDIYRGADQCIL